MVTYISSVDWFDNQAYLLILLHHLRGTESLSLNSSKLSKLSRSEDDFGDLDDFEVAG